MSGVIHTPEGVRDIYGRECDKKRYLERNIEKLFRSFGYQSIETPTIEYIDVFRREVGTTPLRELYKFFDREGDTLVLRPDFTPSMGRAVGMYFSEEEMPLRLCYSGNVFVNSGRLQGRLRESTQMGVELINADSPEADAEILALVLNVMNRVGLVNFQMTIGHVDYFRALTDEAGLSEETVQELQHLLATQNRFGAQELVHHLNLRSDLRDAFLAIPELYGDAVVLKQARKHAINDRAVRAVERLQKIYDLLQNYGCEKNVTFDLGMVTQFRYYTGIVFQAYTYGSGDAVISGGRYNDLLDQFGKAAPAIGFAVKIDSLISVLDRQGIALPVYDRKTMVLYPDHMMNVAVRFARAQRERKMDVACIRFVPGKVLDDYRAYGQRNQFGGIIYLRSPEEAYAIDLGTGTVDPVDISAYLPAEGGDLS